MRFRLGFMLASVLAVTAAGCASAGGGGAGPDGMRPRETAETRDAERALNLALVTGPEEAAPQYETALSAANAAIAADSTNPLAYKLAGQALLGLNRAMEADVMLDTAEELRPAYHGEETEAIREAAWIDQYQRAQPMLDAVDYLGAAEILEGAHAIYSDRPEIMIVLGQIYVQESQPDRAVTLLKQADSLIDARAPQADSALAADWRVTQAEIPVTIAQAYISAERLDEAAGELRSLVMANPDNLVYLTNLAGIYAQTDQPDSAAAVYGRLLQRSDLKPSDMYMVGVGYYNMQRYADAQRAFERGAEAAPRDRDAIEMLTRSIQLQHQRDSTMVTPAALEQLKAVAERWIALDPNSRIGHVILTAAVNRSGDEQRTTELIETMEALAFNVADLQMSRNPSGGANVTGDVQNLNGAPGTPVTLNFTFYDVRGNAVGTQSARVTLGAAESRTPLQVSLSSDQQVDGYGYTIQ